MTLTDEEINKIAKILGITKRYLNAHLTSLGTDLTAQDETDIRAEIVKWEALDEAGTGVVKIHPTESNFGAETMQGSSKDEIARNIAIFLDFEINAYPGIGTIQIV